jgi:hypothetical protein
MHKLSQILYANVKYTMKIHPITNKEQLMWNNISQEIQLCKNVDYEVHKMQVLKSKEDTRC